MVQETIILKEDLNAIKCANIANFSRNYTEENISFIKNDKTLDGHSLFNLFNLHGKEGDEITIKIDGPKEEKILRKIKEIL